MRQHFAFSTRSLRRAIAITNVVLLMTTTGGCGALLLVGGAGASAIAFATGELRTSEEASIQSVDVACTLAIERLAYDDIKVDREADRMRYRAQTPGGEPVDIQLFAHGPERTDLRIRIGIFGDETASRLLLEEIHQSL